MSRKRRAREVRSGGRFLAVHQDIGSSIQHWFCLGQDYKGSEEINGHITLRDCRKFIEWHFHGTSQQQLFKLDQAIEALNAARRDMQSLIALKIKKPTTLKVVRTLKAA